LREEALTVYGTTGADSVLVVNKHGWHSPSEVYWVDLNGNVTRHEKLSLPESATNHGTFLWIATGVVPSPALFTLIATVLLPAELRSRNEALDYRAALIQSLAQGWPQLVLVCLVSAILAVAVFRRHRRYSKSGSLAWAIFVFLLGVPGLVGYWLHRNWPVTERCGECGAVVPRDREMCLVCATDFPPPALKGVEIFA
jgi:hypothetical protein